MKAKEYEIMFCKDGNLYINKAEGNDFRSSDSKAFTEEDYNQVKQWFTKSIWHDASDEPKHTNADVIIEADALNGNRFYAICTFEVPFLIWEIVKRWAYVDDLISKKKD